ncbi:Peptidase OS=Streptomyces alboniger OX=132473 GN=CP975_29225 PE=4 SV=1 [Streptomyces alboniger]
MRTTRVLRLALLPACAALLAFTGTATADGDDGKGGDGKGDAPTEAGTSFRTATAVRQDQEATAEASTGDYLYWAFPVDAGQRATVHATVKLPDAAARHAASTWQVDVYDGLRRRQACRLGTPRKTAERDAASVSLSCSLRTVRAWSEQWANDPLPGTYYLRLTVTDLKDDDLGLPVRAEARVTATDAGGAQAVDGALAEPLVPGAGSDRQRPAEITAPEDGWSSGWWSSRWLWTGAGGVLAALAGVGGYALTRGSGRPARVPQGL